MLTVTALTNAEYLLSSVALGIDEYYTGVGEAPGVWMGRWSPALGVAGMVEADALRALIDGNDPTTGSPLLVGLRERTVKAFDLTFSAPKAVSVLWALGTEPVADVVMGAHREAVATALGFLEERAALARIQVDGVRRHVPTDGWAVAGFVHRTSRAGDPQLHTHCLVPNVVRREDGRCVAIAARPMFVWARAAGSIYQAELQRLLSLRLGVEWQPDRNNTREIAGFTPEVLRTFSKRTVEIEAELEATGARYEAPALRMRADDEASLATRPAKDHTATPETLFGRWQAEAAEIGLQIGAGLEASGVLARPGPARLSASTRSPAVSSTRTHGLCAHSARFAEHDVIEHVAGLAAGRLSTVEITEIAERFLASDLVVRLTPSTTASGWEPARWSTVAQRSLEDDTLGRPRPAHRTSRHTDPGVDRRRAARRVRVLGCRSTSGGLDAVRAGRIGADGARPGRLRQDRDGPRRRRLRHRRRPARDRGRDDCEGRRRARRRRLAGAHDRPLPLRPQRRAAPGGDGRRPRRDLANLDPRRP